MKCHASRLGNVQVEFHSEMCLLGAQGGFDIFAVRIVQACARSVYRRMQRLLVVILYRPTNISGYERDIICMDDGKEQ